MSSSIKHVDVNSLFLGNEENNYNRVINIYLAVRTWLCCSLTAEGKAPCVVVAVAVVAAAAVELAVTKAVVLRCPEPVTETCHTTFAVAADGAANAASCSASGCEERVVEIQVQQTGRSEVAEVLLCLRCSALYYRVASGYRPAQDHRIASSWPAVPSWAAGRTDSSKERPSDSPSTASAVPCAAESAAVPHWPLT